jgi:hypothetical protein
VSTLKNFLKGYNAQLAKSFRDGKHVEQLELFGSRVAVESVLEKLHRVLSAQAFDGTEVHSAVDHQLRGLENEVVAANIKCSIEPQYRNVIPLDAAIEIIGKLLDDMGFISKRSRDKSPRLERPLVPVLQHFGFAAERVPLSGAADGGLSVAILGRDRATMIARAVVEILEIAPPVQQLEILENYLRNEIFDIERQNAAERGHDNA